MRFGVLAILLAAAAAGEDFSRIYLGSRPSVAPDGKRFVFEWCDSIWIAPVGGGTARALETTSNKDNWPVFNRDGTRVVFQSNREGGWKLFEHELASGSVRRITEHTERTTPFCWTPDGTAIIATVLRDHPGAYQSSRIAAIPAIGNAAEKILFDTYGDEPALSPDGTKLLFTREGYPLYRKGVYSTKASQIWLYDLKTGAFSEVVKRLTDARTPLWTPDGGGFYYVSGEDGAMNLWHRDLASGKERQITFFTDDSVIHPALSGDGSTMVFRHLFDFYAVDPRKSERNPRKIVLHPASRPPRPDFRRRYYDSCWNNDENGCVSFCDHGMQIAFTTGGDLFVMDTNLREPVLVHGDSLTHERSCVFSRDGSKLYYVSDHGDGSALWQAECVETNRFWWENTAFKKSVLVNDEKIRTALQVSPDGTMLSWIEPAGQLIIARSDGSEISRHRQGGKCGNYAWSPDNRWLVAEMSDDYGNNDIWILAADGNTPPCNISRHFNWDGHPCWSSDGKLIAFVGVRSNRSTNLFYLYLNPDDERFAQRDKSIEDARNAILEEQGKKKPNADSGGSGKDVIIDFKDIHTRVRAIEIAGGESIATPFFSEKTPNTLAFAATINGDRGTWKVSIPHSLKPSKMTDRTGSAPEWIAKSDRLLWIHDRKPAHFTKTIPISAYQVTCVADYQELGYLSAWGRLRDWFYDPGFHGADWNAIKEKYRLAARNAPSYSVFARILHLLNGELRASHLGFTTTDSSKKEWDIEVKNHAWDEETGHLGVLLDAAHEGEGWKIAAVVPDGPADKTVNAVKPGDVILSINRTPVDPRTNPASVLNGRAGLPLAVEVSSGTNESRIVSIKPVSWSKMRELRNEQFYEARRESVRKLSDDAFGYLHIAKMQWQNYYKFEQEIFAEGFGKEGMVIDVRDNMGGFTADYVINVLCGMNHSFSVMRDAEPAYLSGYWGRPVFDKPIVVLCNQNTASNGEIFTHAMKTLKRGKIVGVTTGGQVIATTDHNLLDLGKLRLPHRGWFLPDGRNMDFHGAEPDVVLWNTPEDEISGRDRQLEKAVEVLRQDVAEQKKNTPDFQPLYRRAE